MTGPRLVSYGGGKQSTALLVLAAQGRIDFQTFVMANVGDDSEHPDSLWYVRNIAQQYGEAHGIKVELIDRTLRDGSVETLYGRLTKEGSRSLPIPVRMSNGAPGTRSCTADFKIKLTGRYAKKLGATAGRRCRPHMAEDRAEAEARGEKRVDNGPRPDCPKCAQPILATVAIGISLDEIQRANNRRVGGHERVVYPLISVGEETGLRMNRQECENLIAREPLPENVLEHLRSLDPSSIPGVYRRQLDSTEWSKLPVPTKSSCYFCPLHRPAAWADLARDRPDLFDKSCELEDLLNKRRDMLGKDHVYFTRFAMPLREAIATDQPLLPMLDDQGGECDSGWCMT